MNPVSNEAALRHYQAWALLVPPQGEPACLDLGQTVFEAVMQRLKISREGVILIKSFEGFRPRAILRENGQWVIGYGHTASAREGASVSEADAELLLQYDLIPIAEALNARTLNDGVAARLNQHQFDALASFAFSVGLDRFLGSNVLSRLNAGFAGEAADALVGWPEPVLPETSLRRRAAERALFVADPASSVTLSDLLVAPLPPPSIAAPEPAQAQQAAIGMLSAPEPALHQPEPSASEVSTPEDVQPIADAADEAEAVPEVVSEQAAPFAPLTAAFAYSSAQARQRYSAYPGVIVGPLPAHTPTVSPMPSPQAEAPDAQTGSAPEIVEANAPPADVLTSVPATDAPAPVATEAVASEAVGNPFGVNPFLAPSTPEPAESEVLRPHFGGAVANAPDVPAPAPVWPAPSPVWPAITAVSEPRTDGELVLTAAPDDDVLASPRPVWPHGDLTSGDAAPLFDDDALRLAPGNIIRHEAVDDVAPASIPWGELGAYGLMGAFGLVSFGMSMAAFRRASQAASDADGTTVIAIVLAVIGAACVGVSAYNLYRRWGRAEEA